MKNKMKNYNMIFSPQILEQLLPPSKSDQFFDALYGDVSEGAYDIRLAFKGHDAGELSFEFELTERPQKCLACNLTYGLPEVFSRHPVIDLKGMLKKIESLLDGAATCEKWKIENTQEISRTLHVIPFRVFLKEA